MVCLQSTEAILHRTSDGILRILMTDLCREKKTCARRLPFNALPMIASDTRYDCAVSMSVIPWSSTPRVLSKWLHLHQQHPIAPANGPRPETDYRYMVSVFFPIVAFSICLPPTSA